MARTRFVVCRLMLHLAGDRIAPLLGVLNEKAQEAINAEGDISVLGEGLVDIAESLLQSESYWRSAANEGDVIWKEAEAADYVQELFTDSAQRYLSQPDLSDNDDDDLLSLPITENIVVMMTIAFEGESPDLETDLASFSALQKGLKTMINLHYQDRLRAVQVHFSPARLGDRLTEDQLLLNFSELIPL
ncbi:DUF1517 domain-containing protein [Roseofilum reptotaenium CS-1145]|uniref:DUF1517 domain-containing protein n=1 Tax=Roseofilum reptotaenium AO1-A TaxID=1925591 RepID=A0A1L9QXW8_9CYAN|nr:DUF1517 domain-containing protein [Roseofilum reptotaenium]MDB9517856.1 DUF1517 domain-containing protein [Roseofilum reptotaenium CS-1145]OJJ27496.1 hypothetical protein BI308_00570 [Roseofilum reptotaenium AO1-A]